jgi:hypothetical protein
MKKLHKNLHLKNLNGHVELHVKEWAEVMCNLRGLRHYASDIERYANDLLYEGRQVEDNQKMKRTSEFDFELQAMEWQLSQIVQSAAKLLSEAGELQAHIHGLRGGNDTLKELQIERAKALKQPTEFYGIANRRID